MSAAGPSSAAGASGAESSATAAASATPATEITVAETAPDRDENADESIGVETRGAAKRKKGKAPAAEPAAKKPKKKAVSRIVVGPARYR